jgi:hypothetical protein
MYTHVSNCKNSKIKEKKRIHFRVNTVLFILNYFKLIHLKLNSIK